MTGRLAASLAALVLVLPGLASAGWAADGAATMKQVVREWSRLVNAGDDGGIARLFRLPAIVEQGGVGYRLKTADHVRIWHSGLPCSGRIRSITVKGKVATVVFVLGKRPGHTCSTPGELAAAAFEIVGGKIVHWTQVAVPDRAPPAPVA